MSNSQCEESGHRPVEVFSVAAVELGDDEEDECQGDVLEEVAMAARSDFELGRFRLLVEVRGCLDTGLGGVSLLHIGSLSGVLLRQ
jgi:hypothetical protein